MHDYINYGGAFKTGICRFLFKQILQGVDHMHSKSICHRDLKPLNVLVSADYSDDRIHEICKICDFGHSQFTYWPFSEVMKGPCGTKGF